MKKYKIGLFGLGVVGSGVYQTVRTNKHLPFSIEKIVVKNPEKKRGFEIDPQLLNYQTTDLINDTELDIIIELINDPHEAFEIVSAALKNKKAVVTANKKMISIYHQELLQIQKENNVPLLYEGAVCGSIPILRLLDQQFTGDEIQNIRTIANGTCNYILTQMATQSWPYDKALQEAQNLGFAESDPYSDVSGEDTRFKLSIMILHAFGVHIPAENIPMVGIQQIDAKAIELANRSGLKFKLIGEAKWENGQLKASVMPHFIQATDDLFQVNEEYNAVKIEAKYASIQFFKGKGAGSFPTSSAVVSNLTDILKNSIYNFPLTPTILNKIQTELEIYYLSDGDQGAIVFDFQEVCFHENDQWIVRATVEDILSLKKNDSSINIIKLSEEVLEIFLNTKVLV
jgi:homoserine dehydrogenase